MQTVDKIKEILGPITAKYGYFVLEMTYKREGGSFVLRIVIDKSGGVKMDECGRFNNELSELLDKGNVIEDRYTLEVSSPGLDRKLKKDADFVWAVGKKIKLTMYAPFEGKSAFSGILLGLGEGTVVVNENETSTEIPREKIASARLNDER